MQTQRNSRGRLRRMSPASCETEAPNRPGDQPTPTAAARRDGETPKPAWTLRAAGREDLSAVRGLLAQCELPVADLERRFASMYVVAEVDGRVIGSAGLELYGRYALMCSLAVSPLWRGERVGEALVQDRLAWARSRGLIAVFLLTLSPHDFERFGFRRVRRDSVPPEIWHSPEFKTLCPQTAVAMALPVSHTDDGLRRDVRERYARIARTVRGRSRESDRRRLSERKGPKESAPCCGDTRDASTCCEPSPTAIEQSEITADLYSTDELSKVPREAAWASLGCGNPTALAELRSGDVVLDLGSGGGIDVLLSARRVGPTGKAYGLDMTDEMLEVARENQRKSGITNVEFLKGHIESVPLPDSSVDVVISNCVINLSTDKARTLAEAHRVLKPGGRFAVSDVVARRALPEAIRGDRASWTACLAGALEEEEYRRLLTEAGFVDVEIEPTRIYRDAGLGAMPACEGSGAGDDDRDRAGSLFMSAFIRARKPVS